MELDDGIVGDVAEVHFAAVLDHVGVFLHHEPADVRVPEPTVGIVGICRRLRELVVHPMVTNPFVNGVLYMKIIFIHIKAKWKLSRKIRIGIHLYIQKIS